MSSIIRATTTSGLQVAPDNSGSLQFQTNGTTTAVTIDTSQNVGIGTTSPIRKFSVASGSGPAYASLSQLSDNPYLEFERWSGTASDYGGARIKGLNDVSGGGGEITFETSNLNTIAAQTFTERMRITSTGLLQFNSGYGSVATAYGCRAWVNFNGQGTVAIRASGNVSSITDNGTGRYTVNFTTAMPDANYSISGAAKLDSSGSFDNFSVVNYARTTTAPTTSNFVISTVVNGGTYTDFPIVNVQVFR